MLGFARSDTGSLAATSPTSCRIQGGTCSTLRRLNRIYQGSVVGLEDLSSEGPQGEVAKDWWGSVTSSSGSASTVTPTMGSGSY